MPKKKYNPFSKRLILNLFLALIPGLGLLASSSLAENPSSPRLNIILVSEDQLSAAHIHAYGYPRETTPYLDVMAREGVLFNKFYASGSWTIPPYCSIMTGLFPSKHQMSLFVQPGAPVLDTHIPLLAEQFEKSGYKTVAFVNNGNAGKFILERGF